MRKLALQLDDLAVESFDVAPREGGGGTVRAHETTGNQIICDCVTNGFECETNHGCTEIDCESVDYCPSAYRCTVGYPGCPHYTLGCPPSTDFCV